MNPSFDSIDLADYAAAEALGSPALRTTRERLPDVEGEFFQVCPAGGREVIVQGVLASSPQVTAELAGADLKAKLRVRQGLVGGTGTYQGTDACSYPNSLLLSYRQTGAVQLSARGGGLQALAGIEARILTQP